MIKSLKPMVACVMCNLIIDDPIKFPCECLSCNVHLHDHFVKDNQITCPECNIAFQIPKEAFRVSNKRIKDILNKELYLNEQEKELQKES